ncbi:hypothetical protein ACYSNM_10960 [Myroides sp. LJL116]
MKSQILERIKALGGDTTNYQPGTLLEELTSINFDAQLYPKFKNESWHLDDEQQPIVGLSDYIKEHLDLFYNNKENFMERITQYFYFDVVDNHGQKIWTSTFFTPFDQATLDYQEWKEVFSNKEKLDLSAFKKVLDVDNPNFIQICFGFSNPDHYYVLANDPNSDNPTVFATDHSSFFEKVEVVGTLEEFLNSFMTPQEFKAFVEKAITN